MSLQEHPDLEGSSRVVTRSEELRAFFLFTVVLSPLAAVACVGGWGFFIWMLQVIFGPPTH